MAAVQVARHLVLCRLVATRRVASLQGNADSRWSHSYMGDDLSASCSGIPLIQGMRWLSRSCLTTAGHLHNWGKGGARKEAWLWPYGRPGDGGPGLSRSQTLKSENENTICGGVFWHAARALIIAVLVRALLQELYLRHASYARYDTIPRYERVVCTLSDKWHENLPQILYRSRFAR